MLISILWNIPIVSMDIRLKYVSHGNTVVLFTNMLFVNLLWRVYSRPSSTYRYQHYITTCRLQVWQCWVYPYECGSAEEPSLLRLLTVYCIEAKYPQRIHTDTLSYLTKTPSFILIFTVGYISFIPYLYVCLWLSPLCLSLFQIYCLIK